MTTPGLPRPEARIRIGLTLFFGLAACHAWAVKARGGRDLGVLLEAGARALRGEPLYRLSSDIWCFKYSPPVALLVAPVSLLPADVASLALALGSALALVGVFLFASRRTGAQGRPASQILVLALSAPYTLHLLALGQNDGLLVGLAVASESIALLHPGLSGVLLALACIVKPPYLLLAALALVLGERRRLVGLATGLALTFGATSLRYGFAGLASEMQGWRSLLATTTRPLLCDEQNQSFWAVACTYLARPEDGARYPIVVALASAALVAATAGLVFRAPLREDRRRFLLFSACLYLTAPLSPLGWRTNLLAAVPALFVLVENARDASSALVRRLSWGVIAFALAVELSTYDLVGRRAFFYLLQHRHYALASAIAIVAAFLGAAMEARRSAPALTAAGSRRE